MTPYKLIGNWITGIFASAFAVISTYQEQFDSAVRSIAGVLGLIVTAITLYKLIASKPKKNQ